MTVGSDRLTDLFLGEEWSRTRRAFILTVGFATLGVVLDYHVLLTKFDNEVLVALHAVFSLDGYLLSGHATGMLLVVSLAGLHAYLNEGYLPSILLGWSPVYGNVIWTIGSLTAIENYFLDPVAAFERTFPEAFVLATLGFLIGLGLRWVQKRRQSHTMPGSGSDELQPTE